MTLEEELSTPNDDLKYILNLIKESVDRFKNTIKDLTDITKIQKDMQDDVEDIDPKEVINDILLSIREMVLAHKADVKIECEPCPTIRFSRKNFKSIIYNLITNGIKYHHPERDPLITVKLQDIDDRILLSVSDNGLGIPKSKQSKVFSMFKRFHDHVEGTGIGLYIVKRIVDNNKGTIELESEENKGTTFKVYLRK
jgi:signal transduction histidine kinase